MNILYMSELHMYIVPILQAIEPGFRRAKAACPISSQDVNPVLGHAGSCCLFCWLLDKSDPLEMSPKGFGVTF